MSANGNYGDYNDRMPPFAPFLTEADSAGYQDRKNQNLLLPDDVNAVLTRSAFREQSLTRWQKI